ncbi:MAG: hypothetical protein IJ851_01885 [Eubacterium sp.]|nr:hypothetical protein [Eubacterium sp.]
MTGKEIRAEIIKSKLKIWQVAKAYGVADTTFSKYLRSDFNEEETTRILNIIHELAEGVK